MSLSDSPKNLIECPTQDIVGVLTDVDDTLTEHGLLHATTFLALWKLHGAGLKVIPVTGRSTGWAHMMLTQWPVDAVVAESGGTYLTKTPTGAIDVHYFDNNSVAKRDQLMRDCTELLKLFSPLKFALDNQYRCADVAIDYNEQVTLGDTQGSLVQEFIAQLKAKDYQARTSSIHINAWFGQYDKAPGTTRLLEDHFASIADTNRWVFVGDAPNDQSMFAQFAHSIAVANIRPYLKSGRLKNQPAYITEQSNGAGFCEVVEHLLQHRTRNSR